MRATERVERNEEANRNEDYCDMVERVSKWHEMLRPVLQNCEKRNNFDIHALGSDIIDLFPEEATEQPKEISFTDIMSDRDQTYTARYFLSLLLLTNNKNVQLKVMHPEQNGKIACSKDDIKIKLKSRSRHLDEVNKIDERLNQPGDATAAEKSTTFAVPANDDYDAPSTSKKKKSQKRKRTE